MELGVNLLNHTLARPFSVVGKAQHMKSILSFIICISATMYGGAVSVTDGWLVSCLLEALLLSGPSWSLLSALVPSYSSP